MNKDFVPYEQALELKELGFDESIPTFYTYPENELSYTMNGHNQVSVRRNSQFGYAVSAPTFAQAFRWFREKHNLSYWIQKDWEDGVLLGYEGYIEEEDGYRDCGTYLTYERSRTCLSLKN